jgi:Zn-dependent M28 family amino/carboxypeptidase
VAAILEIACILFSIDSKYTISFILFSGEEHGLKDSEHYADAITRKNEDPSLVINLNIIDVPDYHALNTIIEKKDRVVQHNLHVILEALRGSILVGFDNIFLF